KMAGLVLHVRVEWQARPGLVHEDVIVGRSTARRGVDQRKDGTLEKGNIPLLRWDDTCLTGNVLDLPLQEPEQAVEQFTRGGTTRKAKLLLGGSRKSALTLIGKR